MKAYYAILNAEQVSPIPESILNPSGKKKNKSTTTKRRQSSIIDVTKSKDKMQPSPATKKAKKSDPTPATETDKKEASADKKKKKRSGRSSPGPTADPMASSGQGENWKRSLSFQHTVR